MTTPPSSPLPPWPDNEWQRILSAWACTQDYGTSERLISRRQLLQPLLEDCLRSIAVRHAFVVDETSLVLDALLFLDERMDLPGRLLTCRILLESFFLKAVKTDRRARLSDLRDPLAPWHSFRMQVNLESRRLRRYFLAFLPRSSNHSFAGITALRKPNKHWSTIWDRLTEGVPAACIPNSWAIVRRGAQGSLVSELGPGSPQLVLPPPRDWKKLLAEPLHRAGALLESRKPGLVGLFLPPGVIPNSVQQFSTELAAVLEGVGGLPKSDESLQLSLDKILGRQGPDTFNSVDLQPETLLVQAEDLGFSKFKSQSLLGITALRASRFEQSRQRLERSLSHCTNSVQIAFTLGNIAGLLMSQGSYSEAMRYLQDALAYNPNSPIVRHNLIILVRLISASDEMGDAQNA